MANNFYDDKKGRYELKPVTIEMADQAVVDYFDKTLALKVDTERGRDKVHVVFAAGERWALIRDKKGIRDDNGTLILPLIAVRRTDMDRTPRFGGMHQEVPYITVSKVIHPKTPNMQNRVYERRVNKGFYEPKRDPIIETLTLPFPDFATVYYEISIWTQYQTQMNEILERIFYAYDHMDTFVIPVEYDGNKRKGNSYYFVGFRDGNVTPESNVEEFTGQERIIKYLYIIKVPIYLMLDPKDEALSYGRDEEGGEYRNVVYKQQNVVDVKLTEHVSTPEEFEEIFG